MHNRHSVYVFALLFLAGLPCAAQVDPRNHVIMGIVRDEASHEPLAGVRIELVSGGDQLVAPPTDTSTEGQFQLGCKKGDFYILAKKSGYVPLQVKVSLGPSQETDVAIDLKRQAAEESSGAGPGEAVSAHQLSVPSKAREAYEKAMELMNSKKDYPGALAQFQSAIAEYPSYYEAYAEIGIVHNFLGEAQAAEEALRKSVALSSGKYSYAILNLAELLNNTGRFADAEPLALQASAFEDSGWRGYYELARAQFGLKRAADAEESAAKARDLKPDYPLVYLMLTNIHLSLRNYASVLQDIDAYLGLVPNSPTSDQVRKTRQQVERALEKTRAQNAVVPRS
jgi:tetratricopeptide (TPR) repeat protein